MAKHWKYIRWTKIWTPFEKLQARSSDWNEALSKWKDNMQIKTICIFWNKQPYYIYIYISMHVKVHVYENNVTVWMYDMIVNVYACAVVNVPVYMYENIRM